MAVCHARRQGLLWQPNKENPLRFRAGDRCGWVGGSGRAGVRETVDNNVAMAPELLGP